MKFKDALQVYKFQIIEMIMQGNDEDFLDLVWKLCTQESAEVSA